MAYHLTDAAKTAFQNGAHTATITITLASGSAPSDFTMDANGVLTDSFSLDANGVLSASGGLAESSGGILSLSGGSTLTVTEANIRQGGLVIDRRSGQGEHIVLGTAMASEMTLVLDNSTGAFDGIDFIGAEANVVVGATYNGSSYACPMGIFVVDGYTRERGILTLTGLDYMTKFDRAFDFSGLGSSETLSAIINYICTTCGVTLADVGTVSGMSDTIYLKKPTTSYSCRQYLSWALQCLNALGYIDWNGELSISHFNTSSFSTYSFTRNGGVVLNSSQLFSYRPGQGRIAWQNKVMQFSHSTGQADFAFFSPPVPYPSFTSDTLLFRYPIVGNQLFIGNYLASGSLPQISPNPAWVPYGARLSGDDYTGYIPFTAEVVACPWLWPGDGVRFNLASGQNCSTLTSVSFTLNGRTRLACGETAKDPFDTANGEYSFNDQTAFSPTQDATINSKLVPYLLIAPDTATAATARANLGLSFQPGETLTIGNLTPISGFVTSGTTVIMLTVPVSKGLQDVSGVTVTAMTGGLRGVSGYVDSTTSSTDWLANSDYTITATIVAGCGVRIQVTKSSALTNVDNNTPVAFPCNPLTLTFS